MHEAEAAVQAHAMVMAMQKREEQMAGGGVGGGGGDSWIVSHIQSFPVAASLGGMLMTSGVGRSWPVLSGKTASCKDNSRT